jgi:hypothetical protein
MGVDHILAKLIEGAHIRDFHQRGGRKARVAASAQLHATRGSRFIVRKLDIRDYQGCSTVMSGITVRPSSCSW